MGGGGQMIFKRIKGALWAALGVILSLGWLVVQAWQRGASSARAEDKAKQYETDSEARQRGRDAIQDGRDSGLSPADRMRRNDGDWRGL